jgi:hypothetical protein
MRAVAKRTILVAIALICVACSSGHKATQSHTAGERSATYQASDVVAVRSTPYPEGPPSPRVSVGHSGWSQIAAALPRTLPAQLTQPKGCSAGNITTLTINGGKTIDYGPCLRPRSIDALRCVLAHAPVGCR